MDLYFECNSGISGDIAISTTDFDVILPEHKHHEHNHEHNHEHHHEHRNLDDVNEIIDKAEISENAKNLANFKNIYPN